MINERIIFNILRYLLLLIKMAQLGFKKAKQAFQNFAFLTKIKSLLRFIQSRPF